MKVIEYLRNTDRLFAVVMIVFSTIMYVLIGGMEEPYSPGALSASTYPRLILASIVIVSFLLMIRPAGLKPSNTEKSFRGIQVIIVIAVYIALLEKIGFFILTAFILLVIPLLAGMKRYRLILFSIVMVMAGLYGVFIEVLNIPLPQGLLGD